MKLAFILIVFLGLIPVSVMSQIPDEQAMAGSASLIKGDFEKAIISLSSAINRNNSDDQLFIKRGIAYLQMNDAESAINDFTEANLINPRVADLWLAKAYANSGNTEKAFEYLNSHLSSPFRVSEDSIRKDPDFDVLQNSKGWADLWNKEWYKDSDKIITDVQYYTRKNQFDEAISILDREISRDPGNLNLLYNRGKVFNKQGNYAAAVGDLSTVINSDKKNKNAYVQRGYAYQKTQRNKEAVADYSRAIKIDQAEFGLYLKRAEAYAGLADYSSAIRDVLLYLKYFDDDLNAIYQCGEYYYASEDYINALKLFNRTLTEDPNNPVYYKARGKAYLKTSTYRYAIHDLTMSLDLNPNDAETWMYHGIAVIESGDVQKGCSSLQKARNMGSTEAVRIMLEKCRNE